MNDAIVHFTLGSSPLITLFPFLVIYHNYAGLTDEEKENSKINPEMVLIGLPILFGVLFAVLYSMAGMIPRKIKNSIYLRFVVCGAVTSLLLSLIADYVFNLYEDWLGVTHTGIWHAGVFVFYFIWFYTVGQWVRSQVLYGPTAPSSSSSSKSSSSTSGSSVASSLSPQSSKSSYIYDKFANKSS